MILDIGIVIESADCRCEWHHQSLLMTCSHRFHGGHQEGVNLPCNLEGRVVSLASSLGYNYAVIQRARIKSICPII
jgi:hypothetical protein